VRVFRSVLRGLAPVVLIAVAASLASAVPATARTDAWITGGVTPAITGFPTTPQTVSLDIRGHVVGDDVDGEFPATTKRIVLWFTHGARVNGALFPSCDAGRLARRRGSPRACPRGSKLGGGWARGASLSVVARIHIDVYNGPGGRTLIFYFSMANPVLIREMLVAPFEQLRGNRDYGFRVTLDVPNGLQELQPGMVVSLMDFDTRVGATTKVRQDGRMVRKSYIEVMTCPPGALVRARGEFDFTNGTSSDVDAYLGCGTAPPFGFVTPGTTPVAPPPAGG
jgi:hypothetical protein